MIHMNIDTKNVSSLVLYCTIFIFELIFKNVEIQKIRYFPFKMIICFNYIQFLNIMFNSTMNKILKKILHAQNIQWGENQNEKSLMN